jgi:Tripartite tricarboxylate transporter family receptor
VIAGRVDFAFLPIGIVVSHIREGKLRALAVNGPKRASALPDVPIAVHRPIFVGGLRSGGGQGGAATSEATVRDRSPFAGRQRTS